ncbi:MAG: hypothetical protein HN736_10180 [Anaerolineae bacterium]|jgi:hypothetical protein|nr:hypothetical protein [Anaerolineae bacterium]MBT4308851.1 hypothetical protein [Anaerolineae bacterium]MBT4457218.1 hypothetical protein [Anaerolineae bacterium]MBT4841929.1 hypothetical protein [Anaerolineae bacterium]MBT6062597.1 hypothetical protein [Anaerolineae bacterium]
MSHKRKFFSALAIFMLVALTIVPTASAFEGREGNHVVIEADEIIEDDLYIGAESVTVDGVIKGDLFVGAGTVTINGTVEGDLMVGTQSLVINGSVEDDVRGFAAAFQLGSDAKIGDDLLFGGGSLEAKSGSLIGGDIVVGAGQVLVAGDTEGDILAGTGAFELSGNVTGNVSAYVDSSTENEGVPPMSFGPSMNISIPSVSPGITIDKAASIGGNLSYTAFDELSFPAGVVAGETLRVEPNYAEYEYDRPTPPTASDMAGFWALGLLRTIITLTAIGLLLGWLFPNFLAGAEYKLQTETMPSLGWGVIAYAAFYFALLVIFTAMILGAIIFGFLSLGGLSGTIVVLGLLALFALIVGFILTVAYLTKIIVSLLGGKLILARVKPEWVNHKVYPLLVGVILLSLIMSIPFVGWLVKLIVVLFGLGALWLLGREQFGKKEEVAVVEV